MQMREDELNRKMKLVRNQLRKNNQDPEVDPKDFFDLSWHREFDPHLELAQLARDHVCSVVPNFSESASANILEAALDSVVSRQVLENNVLPREEFGGEVEESEPCYPFSLPNWWPKVEPETEEDLQVGARSLLSFFSKDTGFY